jgi:F-type H+-transporting ATPase subunit epsilon
MAVPRIPSSLALEIVTPEHPLVREQVDEVEIPAAGGYIGVLPGHTPLLATLQVGVLWYRKGTEKLFLAIAYGFAEVMPDRVTILAQIAERAEDIDVTRAQSAKSRAEQRLSRHTSDMDVERARIALIKALTRVQVSARARAKA